MRVEQLYYFEKIYDEKSMTKAAEQLFVSQPAMSIAIANLEKELGADLLLRQKKGVTITDKGEEVIEYVRAALRNIEKIQEIMRDDSMQELRVLSIPVLSTMALPTILSNWKKQHLQINIYAEEVGRTSILEAFHSGVAAQENYFMLCTLTAQEKLELEPKLQEKQFTCLYLGTDREYCYAGKKIFAGKDTVMHKDCKEITEIIYGDNLELDPHAVETKKVALTSSSGKRIVHDWKDYVAVNNIMLFKQLIQDEVGAAIMPSAWISDEELNENRNLRRIAITPEDTVDYYLIYPQKQTMEAYEEDFIQEVQNYFTEWNMKRQEKFL